MSEYTIGADPAEDGFDPSVFITVNGASQHLIDCYWRDRQQQFVMDVTRMQQQMDSEMRRVMGFSDEQAPRIASNSIMDMKWNYLMEKAIEQELEARRKILFQRAAENHKQENEDEQLPS